jgi:hypothetical protein
MDLFLMMCFYLLIVFVHNPLPIPNFNYTFYSPQLYAVLKCSSPAKPAGN